MIIRISTPRQMLSGVRCAWQGIEEGCMESESMKPISNTAFYCCGVRMDDAERANPICGDMYAKVFMDEQGLRIYDFFKTETNSNLSIIARHRIIDDLLRQALTADPDQLVMTIGAGF